MFYVFQAGIAVYAYSTDNIVDCYSFVRKLGGSWSVLAQGNQGVMDITQTVLENL